MDLSTNKEGRALRTRDFKRNNGTALSIYRCVLALVRKADGTSVSDADTDVVKRRGGFNPGPVNWHWIDTDQGMDAVTDAVFYAPEINEGR